MHRFFYSKLAITNIKKNAKFYLPYILACIGSIMLFYVMEMIARHPDLDKLRGSESIKSMMGMGGIIIGVFSVVFIFYTNQFLIKRRKKELGLYNILGMEKRHIAKILLRETFFIAVIALILGIFCGILFSRLIILLFQKVLNYSVVFSQQISIGSIITSFLLFGAIFLLCLLFNLAKIKLANPIELLKGGNVGEREPKTKFLLAIIGFGCIGGGYYIAFTTQSPLQALTLFFLAVLLVIIGTYCVFTAGSIFILKLLRKKKKFYYQTKHFASVSGMIYRMKQNAIGLANICILCTMVLVMVSGTVSLYLGVEDAISVRSQSDIMIRDSYEEYKEEDFNAIVASAKASIAKTNTKLIDMRYYHSLSFFAVINENQISLPKANLADASTACELVFMSLEEYNRLTNQSKSLQDNEVLSYDSEQELSDDFEVFGTAYQIKEKLDQFPITSENTNFVSSTLYLVVPNNSTITWLLEQQKLNYKDEASTINYRLFIDLEGKDKDKVSTFVQIKEDLNQLSKAMSEGNESKLRIYVECKQELREQARLLYGGFLFLGSFLGIVFIMATVLIMYYKQISEGYEDKERFAIMQKVGMSRSEVKKSIRSQVLMVFFAPLVLATVHVAAAFTIIKKLLAILYLTNVSLYIVCLAGTVVIFALIYTIVYAATARTYSKIVG